MDTTFFFVSHRSNNNSKRQKPKLFVTLLMARILSQKIWPDPVLDSGMYILPSPTHQNEPFYFWCRDRIFIWNRKRMLFIGFPKGYKLKRSGTITYILQPWKNCQFNVCGLLMCRVIHTGKYVSLNCYNTQIHSSEAALYLLSSVQFIMMKKWPEK